MDTQENCLAEVPIGPENPGPTLLVPGGQYTLLYDYSNFYTEPVTMASQHCSDVYFKFFFMCQFNEHHHQYLFLFFSPPCVWNLLPEGVCLVLVLLASSPADAVCQRHRSGD